MKLIFAIIHDEDTLSITDELNNKEFRVTKLCSTGGFLRSGNTTLIVGTEEEKVDEVINIIKKYSKKRVQSIVHPFPGGVMNTVPVEVTVGGAIIFVINVERFDKF